jgi:hypothetical protein
VAVQRSPTRLADATNVPAPDVRRRNSNEPLGARVVAVADAICEPFRCSVTLHGTALRFWSTSNSTWMPLSSRLSFSLALELCVQVPRTLTPSPP